MAEYKKHIWGQCNHSSKNGEFALQSSDSALIRNNQKMALSKMYETYFFLFN